MTSRAQGPSAAAAGLLVAICLYLMLAPVWVPSLAPRMYDNARVLEVVLLAVSSLLSLSPVLFPIYVRTWHAWGRGPRWLLVLFAGGGALSAAVSSAPQLGALQIGLVIQLLLLCSVTAAAVRVLSKQAETILAIGLCAGASLVALKFWVTFIQSMHYGKAFSWVSPFLDFANVRFFGQYQAYALFLVLLPLFLIRLNLSWRVVVYFAAANFWALQWMVGSRAVWVGFLAATLAVAALAREGRGRWLVQQGTGVVAGGLIYLVFSSFVLSTPNATPLPAVHSIVKRGGESASERVVLGQAALRLIASHPVTGVGPGQFGLHYSASSTAHPHNSPLQLVTEYGLIPGMAGVALGVMLLILACREIRVRTRQGADMVSVSLAAALIMGLVDSLFSGNLTMPHSQILLCVTAGWLIGRSEIRGPAQGMSTGRLKTLRTGLGGLALLAVLVTLILSFEYLDVIRDMPYPASMRAPSFWQYGRFSAW